jgi:hypothetical protein
MKIDKYFLLSSASSSSTDQHDLGSYGVLTSNRTRAAGGVERTGEVPAEDEVGRSGVSSSSMEGSLFNVREYLLQCAVCK